MLSRWGCVVAVCIGLVPQAQAAERSDNDSGQVQDSTDSDPLVELMSQRARAAKAAAPGLSPTSIEGGQ